MKPRCIDSGIATGPLASEVPGLLVPITPALDSRDCRFGVQMAGLIGTFRAEMEASPGLMLHITSAKDKAGVSTVALELAHAAAALPWSRVLLLQLGERPGPEALAPATASTPMGATFEAAALPSALSAADLAALPSLSDRLRAVYSLVVVDCPPMDRLRCFLGGAAGPAQVMLVLSAARTRVAEAAHTVRQVAQFGGNVRGVILNAPRRAGLFG